MTYPTVSGGVRAIEAETLKCWKEDELFRRTLERDSPEGRFVFYEGPPTANGRPGLHHIISRTIKDLICRHRTMLGYHVTRIAGWDTHGLPVEIETEKRLGISGKPEIEALGIAEFNRACRESVFKYKQEWEELSERIGYWLEYWHPYVTFHPEYVESVWWILRTFADHGLLYRGHKSVPYCPRCGTALSSHEVAQGYREVEDPSLTFAVREAEDPSVGTAVDRGGCGQPPASQRDGTPRRGGRVLLAWTTTPWTVPANAALAVHPSLTYAEVEREGERYVVAESRVEPVLGEHAKIVARYPGSELVGTRYARVLDLVEAVGEPGDGWSVLAAEWVSAEDGTGIVHVAPAFGADDYQLARAHDLPFLQPVDDRGCFRPETKLVGGLPVKDADDEILAELERREALFSRGRIVHSYPHCWRCDSPLIYMARDSWFVRTSEHRNEMLANNEGVGWHPPETGENRFGEWLRGNVDWALSRDRFWGTPLPVWICDRDPRKVHWVGSFRELAELSGGLPDNFDPHRPVIDEITWRCAECPGEMRRSPSVIDVWFDSGAMPFAQWHYPFENKAEFEEHFPADFICEGLDQTRGWFYSLMAISTLLGRGTPFRNVIVNDLVLDAEGRKMSKSRGNVVDPWEAISEHGADPLRWYFVTSSSPWSPKRYDPQAVGEARRRFFDTLLNTYQFFALYANIEEWRPPGRTLESLDEMDRSPELSRGPSTEHLSILDHWLMSRLNGVAKVVADHLAVYEVTPAYRALTEFVVEDLSNWYVRRGRSRYWGAGGGQGNGRMPDGHQGGTAQDDADAAFYTLWHALRTVALLSAPVTPLVSDWLHRALTGRSAHLMPFPRADGVRDGDLEVEMDLARSLSSLGRAAREAAGVRVRQPLRLISVALPNGRRLRGELESLVRAELNIREIAFLADDSGLLVLSVRPNFRALGPRFGKHTQAAAAAIRALPQEALELIRAGGSASFHVNGEEYPLLENEADVVEESRGGLIVRSEAGVTVALDPMIDDELRAEGIARELVNRIQRLRREADLAVTDRIMLRIDGEEIIAAAARVHQEFIGGETLARSVEIGSELAQEGTRTNLTPGDGDWHVRQVSVDGLKATLSLIPYN